MKSVNEWFSDLAWIYTCCHVLSMNIRREFIQKCRSMFVYKFFAMHSVSDTLGGRRWERGKGVLSASLCSLTQRQPPMAIQDGVAIAGIITNYGLSSVTYYTDFHENFYK